MDLLEEAVENLLRLIFSLACLAGAFYLFASFFAGIAKDAKTREAKEAAKRKRDEWECQRRQDISESFDRAVAEVRRVGARFNIADWEIDKLVSQLEDEYNASQQRNFPVSPSHFEDRGWKLLVNLADRCGIPVCYKCQTIDPDFCKNGHCIEPECNASKNDRGCLICAKNRGFNVCMSCKIIEPDRCLGCGECSNCCVCAYY